jgi:hypothetical protein
MPASRAVTVSASPSPEAADELARLSALGPEAQGDVDESLLLANLALTPQSSDCGRPVKRRDK